jgi:hypothetical protein
LGAGTFGEVMTVQNKLDQKLYALKRIAVHDVSPGRKRGSS